MSGACVVKRIKAFGLRLINRASRGCAAHRRRAPLLWRPGLVREKPSPAPAAASSAAVAAAGWSGGLMPDKADSEARSPRSLGLAWTVLDTGGATRPCRSRDTAFSAGETPLRTRHPAPAPDPQRRPPPAGAPPPERRAQATATRPERTVTPWDARAAAAAAAAAAARRMPASWPVIEATQPSQVAPWPPLSTPLSSPSLPPSGTRGG